MFYHITNKERFLFLSDLLTNNAFLWAMKSQILRIWFSLKSEFAFSSKFLTFIVFSAFSCNFMIFKRSAVLFLSPNFTCIYKMWVIFDNKQIPRLSFLHSLLLIRQKTKLQNGCFKKTKHDKFPEKQTFITPWYTQHPKHSFWDSSFCLITDELT